MGDRPLPFSYWGRPPQLRAYEENIEMTRKDYKLIASSILMQLSFYKDLTPEASAVRELARKLATQLEQENPRFNRDVFLVACGVNGVK
jgi:hypothetical protein